MSTHKRSSKSKKSTGKKSSRVAKKAVEEAVKRVERRQARPKAARTRAGLAGYGFKASFDHQWSVPVPAAIGNVTESSRKRVTVLYDRTELVTNVLGNNTATPAVGALHINPRRSAIFPWLSGQALGYETYRFKKLAFRYQPKCGTDEKGVVTIGIDYDVNDATMTSEQQLMTIPGSKQANPYVGFQIDALAGGRSDFAKFLFLSENATTDVTKNLGKLTLMTSGTTSANTVTIGELYVDYVVELSIAQSDNAGVLRGRSCGFLNQVGTGVTVANMFGTATAIMASSSDFMNSSTTLATPFQIFNPGRYFIVVFGSTSGTFTYGSGNVTFTAVSGGSVDYVKEHGTGASTSFTEFGTLQVDGLDVKFNVAMTPLVSSFTGSTSNHLIVCPCSLDFNPILTKEEKMRDELLKAEKRLSVLEERLASRRSSTEIKKKRLIVDDEQCSFVED